MIVRVDVAYILLLHAHVYQIVCCRRLRPDAIAHGYGYLAGWSCTLVCIAWLCGRSSENSNTASRCSQERNKKLYNERKNQNYILIEKASISQEL